MTNNNYHCYFDTLIVYEEPKTLSKCGNCRDLIWALLFIAHLCVFIGIGFWWYSKHNGAISSSSIGQYTPVNLSGAGWGIVGYDI